MKQGRFLSIDPVGVDPENLHTFNRYAYANNNPYKYVDPDGRDAVSVTASLRIPSWIGKAVYGNDFIGQGGGIGFAISYPGFTGGEFDIGSIGELHHSGKDLGGGRGTLDFTYSKGSVKDLEEMVFNLVERIKIGVFM